MFNAFIAPILKLSVDGFRPIFYKVHHWATQAEDLTAREDLSGALRLITFFR
jgi:hypothetical protein